MIVADETEFLEIPGNWHFEKINAIEAWENFPPPWQSIPEFEEILIGVVDRQYNVNHEDLSYKVKLDYADNVTGDVTDVMKFHGNQVASVIGAKSNNYLGMTGLNWWIDVVVADRTKNEKLKEKFALEQILRKRKGSQTVRLVNNSWGMKGHIDITFNPEDEAQRIDMFYAAFRATREFRNIANYYSDKLFIFSAGNGIGNGALNDSGKYGVDSTLENGAIHRDYNCHLQSCLETKVSRLPNVIVVAALQEDTDDEVEENFLAYYSNFGETVDIAAPTVIKAATSYNGVESNYTNSFSGTSAAAPVITTTV